MSLAKYGWLRKATVVILAFSLKLSLRMMRISGQPQAAHGKSVIIINSSCLTLYPHVAITLVRPACREATRP